MDSKRSKELPAYDLRKLKDSFQLALPFLIILISAIPNAGDYYSEKWMLFIMLFGGPFIWALKFHWLMRLTCFYIFINTCFAGFVSHTEFIRSVNVGLQYGGLSCLVSFFILAVCYFKKQLIANTLYYLLITNILLTSLLAMGDTVWLSGLIKNPSMNASLTAILLPLAKGSKKTVLWTWIAGVFLCLVSQATAPLAILLSSGLLYVWFYKKNWLSWLLPLVTLGPLLLVFNTKYFNPLVDALLKSDRGIKWSAFFSWHFLNGNQWFGNGMGSFMTLGPAIQKIEKLDIASGAYLWMHSDVLQVFFEAGYVGATLCLITAIYYLWKAYDRPCLFMSLCGVIILSSNYYPFHFPIHTFVAIGIITLIERDSHGTTTNACA